MSLKLYEISDSYQVALEAYYMAGTDEEQEAALAQLSVLDANLNDKVVNCLAYLKNLEAYVEAIETEAKRLQARKRVFNNKAERFRDYIQHCVEPLGKWTNGVFTISFSNRQRVKIENEALIDSCYKKEVWKIEIDKKELETALRTGAIVTGAELEDYKSMVIK